MTYDAWNKLSNTEKLNYLFRHSVATEQAVERLGAILQGLHERLRKLEAAVTETAA